MKHYLESNSEPDTTMRPKNGQITNFKSTEKYVLTHSGHMDKYHNFTIIETAPQPPPLKSSSMIIVSFNIPSISINGAML
jgi:hypothetical protein